MPHRALGAGECKACFAPRKASLALQNGRGAGYPTRPGGLDSGAMPGEGCHVQTLRRGGCPVALWVLECKACFAQPETSSLPLRFVLLHSADDAHCSVMLNRHRSTVPQESRGCQRGIATRFSLTDPATHQRLATSSGRRRVTEWIPW